MQVINCIVFALLYVHATRHSINSCMLVISYFLYFILILVICTLYKLYDYITITMGFSSLPPVQ